MICINCGKEMKEKQLQHLYLQAITKEQCRFLISFYFEKAKRTH